MFVVCRLSFVVVTGGGVVDCVVVIVFVVAVAVAVVAAIDQSSHQ